MKVETNATPQSVADLYLAMTTEIALLAIKSRGRPEVLAELKGLLEQRRNPIGSKNFINDLLETTQTYAHEMFDWEQRVAMYHQVGGAQEIPRVDTIVGAGRGEPQRLRLADVGIGIQS